MSDQAAATDSHAHAGHDSHDHGLAHVMPVPILLAVFVALCFLTFVTVAIAAIPPSVIDLSAYNIWIAMGIATIKALLVCAFFMHLRYDKLLNIIVFGASFLFVFLFLGIAMMDTHQYKYDVEAWQRMQQGIKPEAGPSLPPPQGPGVVAPTTGDAAAPAPAGAAPAAPKEAPKAAH
ncbi:MAG TPA: cytochrome C oxidase subunit IV family protein [Planctomycetota bacterium]|nr:cytochrome C oxidase subunit IV family protein [Planctomycetota bacterium]